jgi:UDP-N-acetylglucosamine--N-acetylmuramyl-(pentapeptide) pyrophosphoryl-undecaprenol N-acetylglucosamine transferase
MKKYNFLIAAGGTGGHLFPAIAVVEALSRISDEFNFEFTGREDKIENKVVKNLGYDFHPIEVEGLRSIFSLKNILIPFKILSSENKIRKIIKKHNIDAVIATGAYISFPPCVAASKLGVPVFLMESNYNPGKSISMLASKADIIFTSFPETKDFFKDRPVKKIIYAGNPVRNTFSNLIEKEQAKKSLGFDPEKPLVFVFGGSLGSKAINDTLENLIPEFSRHHLQLLWQTGSTYTSANEFIDVSSGESIKKVKFIEDMATAYSAADLVVCRSGASTLSELALLGKPAVLIPLLVGTNKEQEYNARYFEKNGASVVIPQSTISVTLFPAILDLLNNTSKMKEMEICTKRFSKPDAGNYIANTIVEFLDNQN